MLQKKKIRISNDKEYESNINKYRIERNLSWKKLILMTGSNQSTLCALNNGTDSPIYANGKLKSIVHSLMTIFDVSFEDLFPRYVCKISNDEAVISLSEILNNSHEDNTDFLILLRQIRNHLKNTKHARSFELLYAHYYLDIPTSELSIRYNLSEARIRQLLNSVCHVLCNNHNNNIFELC